MKHLLLKAATVATDEGTFTAVISAATIDREKDIVDPAGMVRALQKWVPTGKNIPLAWQHSTAAEDQIGYIDPASAQVVDGEVVVKGWIDQSIDAGQHAWRLVKMGTLGFSFGYLVPDGGATKRAGGGVHIKEMDVFEVTASPTPMNNDTRVLGWKAMSMDDVSTILDRMVTMAQQYIDNAPDTEDAAEMQSILDDLQELVSDVDDAADQAEDTGKSLRARADAVALEHAMGGEIPQGREKTKQQPLNDQGVPAVSLLITTDEMAGFTEGHFKAVWSAAYVNGLPDSSFLHIEDGGTKDDEGKTTPRSLRHFPYKDDSGSIDLPHLQNALARIPQSALPQDVKDRLTAKAQRILDAQKAVDVTDKESSGTRSADPLRAKADAIALEHASGGESLKKPPQPAQKAPVKMLPLKELKRRMRQEMLTALSGKEN